jgi:hypothetical protein
MNTLIQNITNILSFGTVFQNVAFPASTTVMTSAPVCYDPVFHVFYGPLLHDHRVTLSTFIEATSFSSALPFEIEIAALRIRLEMLRHDKAAVDCWRTIEVKERNEKFVTNHVGIIVGLNDHGKLRAECERLTKVGEEGKGALEEMQVKGRQLLNQQDEYIEWGKKMADDFEGRWMVAGIDDGERDEL